MTLTTKTVKIPASLALDRVFRSYESGVRMDELEKRRITARIKEARQNAGLNQDEMAQLLGVTSRTYQNYEGQASPIVPFRRLREIAEATGVSQEWLMNGDPDPSLTVNGELRELAERVASLEALIRERLPPPTG